MSRYKINGRPVPSVTEIIRDVLGNLYPDLPDAEFYMQRGTATHACAALIAKGKDFDYDLQIEGQVAALKKFFAEMRPVVVAVEQKVESRLYQYAGTLDLVAEIGDYLAIVDYKGTLLPTAGLQLAGYAIAWEEMGNDKIKFGLGVEIRDDGIYKLAQYNLKAERREFLALRSVMGIREKYKIGGKHENA